MIFTAETPVGENTKTLGLFGSQHQHNDNNQLKEKYFEVNVIFYTPHFFYYLKGINKVVIAD